eukprot:TRINITY_DN75400_c0_g1_i1.p1 TRINITY_DN75400_c0_g1~~TRINITY_DN75400_c0_g1_i1.p1  ORF type:complete len:381 (+),score=66.50 TRINITY_DN75400_c0_g1_i1:68-1210(+)
MTCAAGTCTPWDVFEKQDPAFCLQTMWNVFSGEYSGALTSNPAQGSCQIDAGSEVDLVAVHESVLEALRVLQNAAKEIDACDEEGIIPEGGAQNAEAITSGSRLITFLLDADVPTKLVAWLEALPFAGQHDAMQLFVDILNHSHPLGVEESLIAYFKNHPNIWQFLLDGCADTRLFTHCAQMLRSSARYPELVEALLESGSALRLIELSKSSNFEISSEAFATLRKVLLSHSSVSAPWIHAEFENFFARFNSLLGAEVDYVVRRQALRLLGDVLANRDFQRVMIAYVAEGQFLQLHMNILRDSSKAIRVDGFATLKLFIANPYKRHNVHNILHKNKDRLVKLLQGLATGGTDGTDETPFSLDLRHVLDVLKTLDAPPSKK